ncbi:cathelicidin-like antimicrobial protein [Haematobia irritans]|uniref:cathelicidin-like antimicrobial protein n=1 Tax=Haematobia irritans TaxID=7368 RepID=UPI003F501D08
MALTVVKYRKSTMGGNPNTPGILMKSKMQSQTQNILSKHQQTSVADINKKSLIKIGGGSGLVINKIPAVIKPAMKRASTVTGDITTNKTAKYSLQTIASAGTPLTSFQWQQTIGGSSNAKKQLGAAISSLPPNTIIKATSASGLHNTNGTSSSLLNQNITSSAVVSPVASMQVRRPTLIIKRDIPERTIRTITLEMIEKNPMVHIGLPYSRLPLLKTVICPTANVTLVDCYLTLKKLKQNEEFSVLADYFDMSEGEAQHGFARTVVKMARYLRFLINWPDSKRYYDRHKNMPYEFRQNLFNVQSMVECLEIDMAPSPLQIDCACFKFILSINTNGIISYVSEAFIGHHDDLTIFKVSNFKDVIPKYLSLVADPGKAVRRKRRPKSIKPQQQKLQPMKQSNTNNNGETDSTTDSADESADDLIQHDGPSQEGRLSKHIASRVAAELASNRSLTVVNSELTSRRVKNYSVPTMRVRETVCRTQMRNMVDSLQEFRILQALAIKEPLVYQYLNEVLIVCAALINLQR